MTRILVMQWYYVQCEKLSIALTSNKRQNDLRVFVLVTSQAFKRHFVTTFIEIVFDKFFKIR